MINDHIVYKMNEFIFFLEVFFFGFCFLLDAWFALSRAFTVSGDSAERSD